MAKINNATRYSNLNNVKYDKENRRWEINGSYKLAAAYGFFTVMVSLPDIYFFSV